MSLNKYYSHVAFVAILSSIAHAEDYVNIQVMHYSEEEERATIVSPAIELNIGLGDGYTLNGHLLSDVLSGGSPTFYDKREADIVSGASPFSNGTHNPSAYARGRTLSTSDIGFGRVDYRDIRYAGGLFLTKLLQNGNTIGGGVSYSNEHEYRIPTMSLTYQHLLDTSIESSLGFDIAYQNGKKLLWCYNTNGCDGVSGASQNVYHQVYNTQLTYNAKFSPDLETSVALFHNSEHGHLNNPYMNVVRNYDTQPIIVNEQRPGTRDGYGTEVSLAKALSQEVTVHGAYRYYQDNWDINSHTLDTSLLYAYNQKLSTDFGLRYYTQNEANFYSSAFNHFTDETFASSDWRLGSYNTYDISLGVSYALTDYLTNNLELSYYKQDDDRQAITLFIGQKVRF